MPVSTRREFLGGGLAATAAMTMSAPTFVASASAIPVYAAIYDTRFAASRAFADEANRHGVPGRVIAGEIHDLWRDDLYHHWKGQPLPLAGMTTHDVLFLLTMMGQEAGMRVIYRAHHALGPDGEEARHTAFGPHDMLVRQPALMGPSALWGRRSAQFITAWPATAITVQPSRSSISQAPCYAACRDALVTWLMVPASLCA